MNTTEVDVTTNVTGSTVLTSAVTVEPRINVSTTRATTVEPTANSTFATTLLTTSSNITDSNVTTSDFLAYNTTDTGGSHSSFVLNSVVLPLLLVVVISLVCGLILYLIRKNKLERLRHRLMPVYNFDASEDGEDWETELLEDTIVGGNRAAQNMTSATLRLDTGLTKGLDLKHLTSSVGDTAIKNGSAKRSPTSKSGLLSSGYNSNTLYTAEKPVV